MTFNENQNATIHRLKGESLNIVSTFETIEMLLNSEGNENQVFFFLRKIVDCCDYISNQIEMEIKENGK